MSFNLFSSLQPDEQAALMIFQWDNYGEQLKALEKTAGVSLDTKLESLEELDKLMRQAPGRVRLDI